MADIYDTCITLIKRGVGNAVTILIMGHIAKSVEVQNVQGIGHGLGARQVVMFGI